jgi:hypothetical protein
MKEIVLGGKGNHIATVDDRDYEMLRAYKWRVLRRGRKSYAGRNERNAAGGIVLMHRFIMNAPDGLDVDHRDGDGLNNCRDNLRLATRSQNMANRGKPRFETATAGFKGVRFRKDTNRYSAQITVNGEYHHIGMFARAVDAARAYDRAARRYFGDFAQLNFPNAIAA